MDCQIGQCSENCQKCIGNSQTCIKCKKQDEDNKNIYLQDNKCIENCGEGYYENVQQKICFKKCEQGSFLEKQASSEYYQCASCMPGCQSCENQIQCKSCKVRYFFDEKSQQCVQCDSNCQSCDINRFCFKCDGKTLMHNNACYEKCPQNTEDNGKGICVNKKCEQHEIMVGGICKQCHSTCKSCYGEKKEMCKECIDKYAKNQENICVPIIDLNKHLNPNQEKDKANLNWLISFSVVVIIFGIFLLFIYIQRKKQLKKEKTFILEGFVNNSDINYGQNQSQSRNQSQFNMTTELTNVGYNNSSKQYNQDNFKSEGDINSAIDFYKSQSQKEDSIEENMTYITNDTFKMKYRHMKNIEIDGQGEVGKYIDIQSQQVVAIKKYNYASDQQILQNGLKEIELLKQMQQQKIPVPYFQTCFIIRSSQDQLDEEEFPEDKKQNTHILALVTELPEYSLYQQIEEKQVANQKFNEKEIIQILSNLSDILSQAHQLKIYHLNLNFKNIWYKNGKWMIFDWYTAGQLSQQATSKKIVERNCKELIQFQYMSPEQRKNQNILIEQVIGDNQIAFDPFLSDVFSLGLILYHIISKQNIEDMNNNSNILENALIDHLMNQQNFDVTLIGTISAMLAWEPQQRISFQQIRQRYYK